MGLGTRVAKSFPDQEELDHILKEIVAIDSRPDL